MFQPASQEVDAQGQKRGVEAAAAEGKQEDDLNQQEMQLAIRLLAKLGLQHEQDKTATARSENLALSMKASSQLARLLEQSRQGYDEEGKKARSACTAEAYRGHPQGKRPDALWRAVAFRVGEWATTNKQALVQELAGKQATTAAAT